eukprot:TRINITY_DN3531_c0_g1_i1.p1 TRINITY_DN3531_c0_g1~~TRINITY_DN3531_c0_g1_i1.p1  ORF type:complete len:896 (-),score=304.34 TRINITY_DN3531_c0_g1_i1:2-2689(-)
MSQGSRLIVKNLPPYLTEERLKTHFSKTGAVTDVKIVKTKGGKSRKFGFVGYKSQEEAEKALKFFNNSFIDTARISVGSALAPGDESIPRPWSKYSQGSSAFVKQHPKSAQKSQFQKTDDIDTIFAKGDSKKRKRDGEDTRDNVKKVKKTNKTEAEGKQGDTKEGEGDLKDDAQFKEYMKLMSKNPSFWANDDAVVEEETHPNQGQKKAVKKKAIYDSDDSGSDSDSEDYQTAPALKSNAIDEESDDDDDDDGDADDDDDDDKSKDDEGISDLDYLKSKRVQSAADFDKYLKSDSSDSDDSDDDAGDDDDSDDDKDSEDEEESGSNSDEEGKGTEKSGKKNKKTEEKKKEEHSLLYAPDVGDSGRLFVRNLSFDCTENDLRDLFSKYGAVASVHLPVDKHTGRSKCFAFVLYSFPPDAIEAQKMLDGVSFQGRLLHILPAKEAFEKKHDVVASSSSAHLSQFQKDKLARLMETSGKSDSWNPLFIRGDAVVDAIASKYNVDKLAILDPSANDMALRQALGETNIIAETKKFLIDEGVAVEALEGLRKKETKIARSSTVILVKNISPSTSDNEIKILFGRFGSITKIVLPPSKTLALVEFAQPTEARAAFSSLAYREHFGVPLFLEWAPTDVWTPRRAEKDRELEAEAKKQAVEANKSVDTSKTKILEKEEEERAEQETHEAHTTLYIKNLNWDTSEKDLEDFISGKTLKITPLRKLRRVTIAKKKDMKNEGKLLSLGYGFVEFDSREEALDALKQLNGKLLDGHALAISFSQKGAPTTTQRTNKHKSLESRNDISTKLMVRNVPFQTNKKELRKLFAAYGELKTLRLPVKQGGKGHRGFAFVEYLTKEEAYNAMQMLANTHLYGRHLVIDFEKGEEGLDEVREKTRQLYEKSNKK